MATQPTTLSGLVAVGAFAVNLGVSLTDWDPPDVLPPVLITIGIVCGLIWLYVQTPLAIARLKAISLQGWKRIGVGALAVGFVLAGVAALAYWDAATDYRASRDRVNTALTEERANLVSVQAEVDLRERQLEALQEKADILTASLVKALGEQQAQATIASAPPLPLGSIKIRTETGVNLENYLAAVEALRSEFGLRATTVEELGRPMRLMPIESYYFVHVVHSAFGRQETWPENASTMQAEDSTFELHSTRDGGRHVLAFIDEGSAARITTLDGQTEQTVDAYARPFGARTVLALIPIERVVSLSYRTADRQVATITVH